MCALKGSGAIWGTQEVLKYALVITWILGRKIDWLTFALRNRWIFPYAEKRSPSIECQLSGLECVDGRCKSYFGDHMVLLWLLWWSHGHQWGRWASCGHQGFQQLNWTMASDDITRCLAQLTINHTIGHLQKNIVLMYWLMLGQS